MKVAGGVLAIIGGILNAIFAYGAYTVAAVVGAGSDFVAAAATNTLEASAAAEVAGAADGYATMFLIWLIVSIVMFIAGIMALVQNSAKLAGIVIIGCTVISLFTGGLAAIIGIILGIIGGILAVVAPPKQNMAA